ncbi:hypothetical protein FRC12_015249 [Ceratobasidium sp. 428]|nr:hypothetical protein FRC12_015249 [Ceratobasidium sp. 428]
MQISYTPAWKVTRRQNGLLTSIAASSTSPRLTVMLKSGDLLLLDIENGSILVKLSFGTTCSVQSVIWYSNSNVLVGCDNGSLYDTCFEPTNTEYSVTMSPFLDVFNQQICLLAFDPDSGLLAVAYANMVALYAYKAKDKGSEDKGSKPTWDAIELIKGLYNNEDSLVNALLFYPLEYGSSSLFVGYAKAGWSVRSYSGSVKRVSPDSSHNVCRIGSTALSGNKKRIAILTLDRTIVVYTFESDGPLLSSMKEVDYEDSAEITPIVPIAFTSDGLTLGGTACGEVVVLQNMDEDTSLIRHEEANHLICVIAWQTHGQKVVIGSSSPDGLTSVLKCYLSSAIVSGKPRTSDTASVTAEMAFKGWEPSDSRWEAGLGAAYFRWHLTISQTAWLRVLGITLVIMLMLFTDPPSGAKYEEVAKDSGETEIMVRDKEANTYWLDFSVRYFARYCWFQVSEWIVCIALGLFGVVTGIWDIVKGIAKLIQLAAAKWACERVGLYKKNGVCPKMTE